MIKIQTDFDADLVFGDDDVTGLQGLILESGGGVKRRNSHHSKVFKDILHRLKGMNAKNITIYVAAHRTRVNYYPDNEYRKIKFNGKTLLNLSNIDLYEFVKAANKQIKQKGKLNPDSPNGSIHKRLLITSELNPDGWNRLLGNTDENFKKEFESIDYNSEAELEYILQRVKKRLRQTKFRKDLLEAYSKTCAVTGCKTEYVLEAAHIKPHSEGGAGVISNGIVLRSDIHDLFDQRDKNGKRLLHITTSYTIELHESLADTEYWEYNGKTIILPLTKNQYPNF